MTNDRRVIVHPDKPALAASVAARFITKIVDVLDEKEIAHISLTGGTMGSAVLEAINASPARDTVDWSRLHFWWSDERWLPEGDPERNDRQARDALLDHIAIEPDHIHPMLASDSGVELDEAARRYADELTAHAAEGSTHPVFEVMFLGVGPDGHVASLFPEKSGIRETEALVVPVRNSPKPPPERISMTLPVINAAERLWMVLAGPDKASVLGLALAGASVHEVPVAGVLGQRRTVFFVDKEASAEVPENLIAPSDEFHALAGNND